MNSLTKINRPEKYIKLLIKYITLLVKDIALSVKSIILPVKDITLFVNYIMMPKKKNFQLLVLILFGVCSIPSLVKGEGLERIANSSNIVDTSKLKDISSLKDSSSLKDISSLESKSHDFFFRAEGGLTLGAYMPEVTPMPEEIRSIDEFTPVGGWHLGLRAMYRPKLSLFSYFVNLGLKHQGMETNTTVKNYYTSVRVDDSSINGYWTGEVNTHCEYLNLMLSPGVNYRMSNSWSAEVGLSVAVPLYTNFSGYVHEGYLRDQTPVGTKISFQGEKRGDYDFSSDLQTWQYVSDIALRYEKGHDSPWQFYIQYDYTLNGLFNVGFNVVNYDMHGRFLNFGLSYLFYTL